jgi:hypothetical protein
MSRRFAILSIRTPKEPNMEILLYHAPNTCVLALT